MKPFLKWVGGKAGLLPELLKYVPPAFGTYYEPFVGGGALFFELTRLGLLKHGAVLSDANEELINTYVQVRDHVSDVILELCVHRDSHSEAHYYEVRKRTPTDPTERAARFVYLNKSCFNGLHRVNAKGHFNVPWGKHKVYEPDEENLRACSKALQGVELKCADFRVALACIEPDDFCYGDPPYFPVSPTADFTSYTKDGFSLADQLTLAAALAKCVERGVHVVASNADTRECRGVYLGGYALTARFQLHEVQARRAVNCKGKGRGKVGELIITGGSP